jgi:quercetin dioxygenase-like cupin family protein
MKDNPPTKHGKILDDNLKRIKELTESVVPLSEIAHIEKISAIYNVKSGECYGVGLLNTKDIAVQHAFLGKNTVMDCHDHDEVEILVVYDGDLIVECPKYVIVGEKGVAIIIQPKTPHIAKSENGCKLIGITIPASSGYPPSKENGQ